MFVLFKIAMKSKFPTMVKNYLKCSGWCTNCEGTWSTGNDGKLAKYALVQEVQAWWYGGYDNFHLAEVQFRTGRLPASISVSANCQTDNHYIHRCQMGIANLKSGERPINAKQMF